MNKNLSICGLPYYINGLKLQSLSIKQGGRMDTKSNKYIVTLLEVSYRYVKK